MEGYLPLAILVVGAILFFVHRFSKDKQLLQLVAGGLLGILKRFATHDSGGGRGAIVRDSPANP